jgi:UDP-glucose 4-epimerase
MGKILVTGGAGYIGSHTCVELIENGYDVIVVDDLSNSSAKAIERIKEIVGEEKAGKIHFIKLNILDRPSLSKVFAEYAIDSVIHFAGLKAVGESCRIPLSYYHNNIEGSISLLEVMREHGVKNIVFSSSATVYGDNEVPYIETQDKRHTFSPYGWTKWMIEQIMCDLAKADPEWNVVLLRYFNPIGAHPSGLIGEDPKGIPNNLVPYISQVAVGRRSELHVFGDDYETEDGTCRRDYLHVVDLAKGHVMALDWMKGKTGVEIFNLGTGTPASVLEVIRAFEAASGCKIPYVIDPRREGDLPEFWANADKARNVLGWTAENTLDDMCRDAWNWQSNNPNGYENE